MIAQNSKLIAFGILLWCLEKEKENKKKEKEEEEDDNL